MCGVQLADQRMIRSVEFEYAPGVGGKIVKTQLRIGLNQYGERVPCGVGAMEFLDDLFGTIDRGDIRATPHIKVGDV